MTTALQGKRGLILGVANEFSLASHIAQACHRAGAQLAISYFPDAPGARPKNAMRVAKLSEAWQAVVVQACDLSQDEQIDALMAAIADKWDGLDFVVHAVANAPFAAISGPYGQVARADFLAAMDASAYSFTAVVQRAAPLCTRGASFLTLSYYGAEKTMPGYNLMGVCKAALEASVRYLAHELGPRGIRVNALSAGAVKTLSASALPHLDQALLYHRLVSPLGANTTGDEVGDAAVFLLSDAARAITASVLHVDQGVHAMGAPDPERVGSLLGKL